MNLRDYVDRAIERARGIAHRALAIRSPSRLFVEEPDRAFAEAARCTVAPVQIIAPPEMVFAVRRVLTGGGITADELRYRLERLMRQPPLPLP